LKLTHYRHSAPLDFDADARRGERDLRAPEERPVSLGSPSAIREGLQAVGEADLDVPDDHTFQVTAERVKASRLRGEIVLEAVGAKPITLLEYQDTQFCLGHRPEPNTSGLKVESL
jgi:hypothetical protein